MQVLLVEDNPADADLTREAMKRGPVRVAVSVVSSGQDALAFLRREGPFAEAPPPDLVLLDLNLPGKDGREVLAEIKSDNTLKQIPVIVMTSSEACQDIIQSYEAHANCYIAKPVDMDEFLKAIAAIEEFWLVLARLPGRVPRNDTQSWSARSSR